MRYFKQALAMMREERLFSGIYIAGTALAIAFTMVMAVVYYIKLAPIYPEPNRARTVYFEGIYIEAESRGAGRCYFGDKAFEEWFLQSKNIFSPILVTLLGIVTDVSLLQPAKALDPMLATLLGMAMEVSLIQFENAHLPMLVTLLGMVIEVRL